MFENTLPLPYMELWLSLARPLPVLFRRSSDRDDVGSQIDLAEITGKTKKIRCPICGWSPSSTSRWTCWDCEHPEYFYGGCGTEWNTFDTGGLCPTCSHQWTWTSCLSCWGWSKHVDWYVDDDNDR